MLSGRINGCQAIEAAEQTLDLLAEQEIDEVARSLWFFASFQNRDGVRLDMCPNFVLLLVKPCLANRVALQMEDMDVRRVGQRRGQLLFHQRLAGIQVRAIDSKSIST